MQLKYGRSKKNCCPVSSGFELVTLSVTPAAGDSLYGGFVLWAVMVPIKMIVLFPPEVFRYFLSIQAHFRNGETEGSEVSGRG